MSLVVGSCIPAAEVHMAADVAPTIAGRSIPLEANTLENSFTAMRPIDSKSLALGLEVLLLLALLFLYFLLGLAAVVGAVVDDAEGSMAEEWASTSADSAMEVGVADPADPAGAAEEVEVEVEVEAAGNSLRGAEVLDGVDPGVWCPCC